jgi:hypothetical protein
VSQTTVAGVPAGSRRVLLERVVASPPTDASGVFGAPVPNRLWGPPPARYEALTYIVVTDRRRSHPPYYFELQRVHTSSSPISRRRRSVAGPGLLASSQCDSNHHGSCRLSSQGRCRRRALLWSKRNLGRAITARSGDRHHRHRRATRADQPKPHLRHARRGSPHALGSCGSLAAGIGRASGSGFPATGNASVLASAGARVGGRTATVAGSTSRVTGSMQTRRAPSRSPRQLHRRRSLRRQAVRSSSRRLPVAACLSRPRRARRSP